MPTATLNNVVVATTESPEIVDGNFYLFVPPASMLARMLTTPGSDSPRQALVERFFKPSAAGTKTSCPWKGTAEYLDVELEDGTVRRPL